VKRALLAVLALALLAACAGDSRLPEARQAIAEGRIEEGLALLQKAAEDNPGDPRARMDYVRERDRIVGQMLADADNARIAGLAIVAEVTYRRALGIEPANPRAQAGLELLRREVGYGALLLKAEGALQAGDLEGALAPLRKVFAEDPAHRGARALERRVEERRVRDSMAPPTLSSAAARKTVSLEFRDVALRSVLEVITRAAGINFVLDKDIRPDARATIFVREQSVAEVIEMLLVTNQLARKVLNDTTLLIYPNTPQKQRDYQDLVVKSFYLSNADPKQTLNMIRAIVKTRDVFVDDKLGLLVMRDTPEAVRLAERLIAAHDLADSEVVLAVEVLEVARTKLLDLGLRWPDQVAYSLVGGAPAGSAAGTTGTPGQFSLREWLKGGPEMVRINVTNPFFVINLRQQDGETNLLANPRIRVKNREKAKVHIGDRVPVITSTGSSTGFVAQSVSYLDVGLKLEVEPQIFLDDEVGIKVSLEVSNIVREVTAGSATSGETLTYQIGTRNATTVLRLRDGETQALAGLITDSDRRTIDRVPGLGDFPVLGRLFSRHSKDSGRSEIVLLVTPRIVRSLVRPEARATEFHSGTESSMGAGSGAAAGPLSSEPFRPPPPPRAAPPAFTPLNPGPPGGIPTPMGPGDLGAPKPPGG
jgi:general secretion pathway protein D